MSGNCDPLTLTYVAGGFTILGGLIVVLFQHLLGKQVRTDESRNMAINGFIDTVTSEINRIKTEEYTSGGSTIGDISIIETIIPQIESIGIDVTAHWEKYKKYEHNRYSKDGEKKAPAIDALNEIIHVLTSSKT